MLAGPLLLGALLGWALAGPGGWWPWRPAPTCPTRRRRCWRRWTCCGGWACRWPGWWRGRCPAGSPPGCRAPEFAAAQALLEGEAPARLQPAEARFLEWRRALVGAPAAGRELAEALLLDARARVSAFAVLAPLAAAMLGLVVLVGAVVGAVPPRLHHRPEHQVNAAALARLATSLALAEDRPLAEVLPHFTVPGSVAAAHARAGRLAPTLRTLGFSPSQVQRPHAAALGAAGGDAAGASLPSRAQLLWPLLQVALYLGLLGLLEAGVLAVLRLKVLPVLAQVARTTHVPGPELLETVSPLLGIILLGVLGYGAWGAAGRGEGAGVGPSPGAGPGGRRRHRAPAGRRA